ncbi:unnamed protein product [Cuscuta epithymum]|uniref:NAC domain-containing protein n=1 Tax=Cuscuta epithymum TaxID=186058 RepID=A0AAV0D867_9ASTE|nr:unnamed protein product [Cuscuta epithymum]
MEGLVPENLEWKGKLPIGYKFRPTEKTLLKDYLLPKVNGLGFPRGIIHEADVYRQQPSDLLLQYPPDTGEMYAYFFTERAKRYKKGSRPNRWTQDGKGVWKITNKIAMVKDGSTVIGKKNVLGFNLHENEAKTNWIMHEHILDEKFVNNLVNDVVLCRIHERKSKKQGLETGGSRGDDLHMPALPPFFYFQPPPLHNMAAAAAPFCQFHDEFQGLVTNHNMGAAGLENVKTSVDWPNPNGDYIMKLMSSNTVAPSNAYTLEVKNNVGVMNGVQVYLPPPQEPPAIDVRPAATVTGVDGETAGDHMATFGQYDDGFELWDIDLEELDSLSNFLDDNFIVNSPFQSSPPPKSNS